VAGDGNVLAKSPRAYPKEDSRLTDDIHFIAGQSHDAELYKDVRGEWRWRLKYDRRIVAVSSEGYKNRIDCKTASDLFLDAKPV